MGSSKYFWTRPAVYAPFPEDVSCFSPVLADSLGSIGTASA